MGDERVEDELRALAPFVTRPVADWLETDPHSLWREVDASLLLADISGFTALSERLARRGRVGAEELTDCLGGCFADLLREADSDGGSLVKFGGDALLLLFDGEDHALRAARSAWRMRARLRTVGNVQTSAGGVRLRMSVGVHSGPVHVYLVGHSHRELVVAGPAATAVVTVEKAASAGQIVVSRATAERLPAGLVGASVDGAGRLLRNRDHGPAPEVVPPTVQATGSIEQAVPAGLRELLASGVLDPEHRHVTIGFLRFRGVDDLFTTGGGDAVASCIQGLVGSVQDAADAAGVTFLGSDVDADGGKLILVAGAPRSLGGDTTRMLRTVRAVLDRAHGFVVTAGINAGHVFAGPVGPDHRRTYTVMGDAVNLTARLMAAAPPGECLVASKVLDHASTTFAATEVPPFPVKGKRDPIGACRLGREQPAEPRRHRWVGPFVGRSDEVTALQSAAAQAFAGNGGVVAVTGAAGVGKTRLVAEALQPMTEAAGATTISVMCEPYEKLSTYRAAARLLRAVVGHAVGDTTGGIEPRAVLAAAGLPADDVAAGVLADVLGRGDRSGAAALDPRYHRQETALVFGEVLAGCLPRPTVLVMDDTHSMDEASAELLELVTASVAAHPWLVVTARRPAPGGLDLAGRADLTLEVVQLSQEDVSTLIRALTADAPLSPSREAALADRASGNPLFVHELLRVTANRIAGATEDDLPETLDAVVAEEVDGLPLVDRRLLRQLSVLGSVVDVELAAEVVDLSPGDGPEQLAQRLAHRLGEFLQPDGAEFRFRHAVLREVAYRSLPYRERRILHGRAGLALERRTGTGSVPSALSFHFEQAGDHGRSWRHAVTAGSAAMELHAAEEARDLYERALQAARHLPELEAGELADVWEALGDACQVASDGERALDAYRRCLRLRDHDPISIARTALKSVRTSRHRGSLHAALRWALRGLRAIEAADTPAAQQLRPMLYGAVAELRLEQNRHREALRWAQQAMTEAEACGGGVALAQALVALDAAHHGLGEADKAVHSARALAVYEELGDEANRAVVLNNLGAFAYFQGRWAEAQDLYERSAEASRRVGNHLDAEAASGNLAELLIHQGHLDRAERLLYDAERTWSALGYGYGVALATRYLARVDLRRGDMDRAVARFRSARAVFERYGAEAKARETDVWEAECEAERGDLARASELVDAVEGGDAAANSADLRCHVHRVRALVAARTGDLGRARVEVETSLAAARAAGLAIDAVLALAALVEVCAAGAQPVPDGAEEELQATLCRLGIEKVPTLLS